MPTSSSNKKPRVDEGKDEGTTLRNIWIGATLSIIVVLIGLVSTLGPAWIEQQAAMRNTQIAQVPTPTTAASVRIAFVSIRDGDDSWQIYVMNADGSQRTRLTPSEAHDEEPAWSPDGQRIVFVSDVRGNDAMTNLDDNIDIHVMNADGSQRTRLTTDEALDNAPAWSPDGQRIAFVSSRDDNWAIYVMNADGSQQTRLTTNEVDDFEPAWSPDGQRIAFASDGQIYVMNADGSQRTRLTTSTLNQLRLSHPVWSPDGQRIAFLAGSQIYVMNADGSQPTRLTTDEVSVYTLAWWPDGQRIAFISDGQIYVMNADGSQPTRLTINEADTIGQIAIGASQPTMR